MEHDTQYITFSRASSVFTDDSSITLVDSEAATSQSPSFLPATTRQLNPGPPRAQSQDSQDNLKSFKMSLADPTWKALLVALKRYEIDSDWQNYAMLVSYGAPENRIERCLSYDEKPSLIYNKLKDAKKNPVFVFRHIKDIRSPIAVAQQKQAASATEGGPTKAASSGVGRTQSPGQSDPPRLQVNSQLPNQPGLLTGVPNGQMGDPKLMSPQVENKNDTLADTSRPQHDGGTAGGAEGGTPPVFREMSSTTGVSFAVAIYPYMAEQLDEFDVVVGDTFVIASRARGWWVVQRDPIGSGQVESDLAKQGWVPAGCMLETKVPVAVAIQEATARSSMTGCTPPSQPETTPILPLSILTTSFPAIAFMDFKKKGEGELDLQKDNSLRVYKRYNHWSYAVKEHSGDRGWVPSWLIGKVLSSYGTPATPSAANAPNLVPGDQNVSYGIELSQHA